LRQSLIYHRSGQANIISRKKTSSSTSMIDEGTHLSQGTDSGQSQPRMDTLARPTERLRNTNLPPSNATPPHDDKEISSQELSEHESQHPSLVVVLDQTVAGSELRVGYAYVEHQADIASHKSMGAVPLSEDSPSFFPKPASPGGSQESQVDLRASGSIAGSSTVYHGSDAYEMGSRHARGRELSTAVDLSSAETISRTLSWGRLPSLPTMLLLAPLLAFRSWTQTTHTTNIIPMHRDSHMTKSVHKRCLAYLDCRVRVTQIPTLSRKRTMLQSLSSYERARRLAAQVQRSPVTTATAWNSATTATPPP
jgi:hypothetical protein